MDAHFEQEGRRDHQGEGGQFRDTGPTEAEQEEEHQVLRAELTAHTTRVAPGGKPDRVRALHSDGLACLFFLGGARPRLMPRGPRVRLFPPAAAGARGRLTGLPAEAAMEDVAAMPARSS